MNPPHLPPFRTLASLPRSRPLSADLRLGWADAPLLAEEISGDPVQNSDTNSADDSRNEILEAALGEECGSDPDLWLYRQRTVSLLRRYQRLSVEIGRLPSLLGREIFHAQLTSYQMSSFEDTVIFVHDIDRCLARLDEFDRRLIAKTVFQHFSQDEAAGRLKCWRRTVGRRLPETLDRLSTIFLAGGLLTRLPGSILKSGKTCQEGKNDVFPASDS